MSKSETSLYWRLDFNVHAHNVQDRIYGRGVWPIIKQWKNKIPREKIIKKAFRLIIQMLEDHPAKRARISQVMFRGKTAKKEMFWTTHIRLKPNLKYLEDFRGRKPEECFE